MKRGRSRPPLPGAAAERGQRTRGGLARPEGPRGSSDLRSGAALAPAHASAARPAADGGRGELPSNFVLLGEFGRVHGLRGEVRLKSYTAEPAAIARYGPLTGADGRTYTLTHLRQAAGDQPGMLVARVDGIATREAAEALNRLALHVERAKLDAETEEDEFLLADLIGLRAEDEEGQTLGRVTDVPNYGGGDLIEIALAARRETVLVPFTKAFVPEVDVKAGKVVVAASELLAEEEREPDSPEESAP